MYSIKTQAKRKTPGEKNRSLSVAYIILAAVPVLAGCNFQFGGDRSFQPLDEVTIPTGFTFATNRTVEFRLAINALDESDTLVPYVGPVHVIHPGEAGDEILGTGITDLLGFVDFSANIPASVSSVIIRPEQNSLTGMYILSDFDQTLDTGTLLVERTLSLPGGSGKSAGAHSPGKESRPFPTGAVSRDLYPKASSPVPFVNSGTGYLMLASYDATTGLPAVGSSGILDPRPWFSFKQSFKKNVAFTFPEGKKIPDSYVNTGDMTNIVLDASAEIMVTMASENSAANNAIGYFVRKKTTIPRLVSDTPPASDIVIIFPNASLSGSGGGLYQGDSVQLRNSDPTSVNYRTTTFDKDMVISWVLIPGAFAGGKITTPNGRYYSLPVLNPEPADYTDTQSAHVAQLLYNKPPYNGTKSFFLVGFEDSLRSTAADGDFNDDFNDVLLTVSVSPTTAVSATGLPEVKDETQISDSDKDGVIDAFDEYPSDASRSSSVSYPSSTGYATVMYEDRWPSLGDYDFNDLVVDVRLKTVSNAAGKAVDLVGNFKIRAAGAELKSGLAFSLPIASASINSVSYSTKQIDTKLFSPGTNGVESSGSNSVIPVFSSAHGLFGVGAMVLEFVNTNTAAVVRSPVYLTVTINFKSGANIPAAVISGAVPDIFLTGYLDIPGKTDLRKEIHTLGSQPTALAAPYPFGELDDRSPKPPAAGLYYKDKRGSPWALLIPTSAKYPVEKSQLASSYRYFSQWVYSGGVDYPDWYNSDKPDYVDSTKLFLLEK